MNTPNPEGGDVSDREYEARYATAERLAKPPSVSYCDFCGVRPGELHAFDCVALDDEDAPHG